jgi:hypothetical protein
MLALALQFSRSSHRIVANTKLASSTASGAASLARKPTVRTGKREKLPQNGREDKNSRINQQGNLSLNKLTSRLNRQCTNWE